MAAKKRKLEKDEIEWGEFQLVGISASVSDYTLCFYLNEILQADFSRIDDHQLFIKNLDKNVSFRAFQWNDEITGVNYMLFNNRSGSNILLPEISGVDCILKITGQTDVPKLIAALKNIESVHSAMVLQAMKLKAVIHHLDYYPNTDTEKTNKTYDENGY